MKGFKTWMKKEGLSILFDIGLVLSIILIIEGLIQAMPYGCCIIWLGLLLNKEMNKTKLD